MKFRTTLELHGKTATGFQVPEDIVLSFGVGKRPPVTVTVNGYTYRSTVAPMAGSYFIPLASEHRTAAEVSAGDELEVTLELDTAPREVELPADLKSALDANPAARAAFEALSYSNKRRHVLNIEGAKAEATRMKRIEKVVSDLASGKG